MAKTSGFVEQVRKRLMAEFEGSDEAIEGRYRLSDDVALAQFPYNHQHKPGRTALQKLIEDLEGRDLEAVLGMYKARDLARKYHLDLSTVTQWKRRLGMRTGKEVMREAS